jgi:hypothetical protein
MEEERAMIYACLVYLQEKDMAALSPAELLQLDRESMANDDALAASGHLIVAQALEPVVTATTVRVRGGKVSTTDGPFAETKEHLGGFLLINAGNLDEAIRIAAETPIARIGSIEVRPVLDVRARLRRQGAS